MDESPEVRQVTAQVRQDTSRQLLKKPIVVMLRNPGAIEIGLTQQNLSRFTYGVGDLILTRTQTEEWVRWPSQLEMLMVTIPETSLEAVAEETGSGVLELQGTPHLNDRRIPPLMQALDMEHATGFQSGRLYLDSLGQALAAVLAQAHGNLRKPLRTHKRGLAPHQLRRVTSFLIEHLDQDLTLLQLAAVAGLSAAYFSQLFRQSTGVSPHQFLMQVRIDRARELLRNPGSRILDVAIACGFQTQQHFARVFRDLNRITPSDYRRQILR